MKLRVIVSARAQRQARKLAAWWRRNREKAPTAFREELRRVYDLISTDPEIGQLVDEEETPGLRRRPVHRTPYQVYYVPRIDEGEVFVVAVWSSMREEGPPLDDL